MTSTSPADRHDSPRTPTAEILPLVYDELRRLAAAKLAREAPGATLDATALVHEAYLRLAGPAADAARWDGRGHFFAAAAEAMRRILVDRARARRSLKRGGGADRSDVDPADLAAGPDADPFDLIALDEALAKLERHDREAASLVKLRYFAGLTHEQAAEALGVSRRVADRHWTLARAWLLRRLGPG